jgi:hypothetical protein
MQVAKATRRALMTGTLRTRSKPLNGFAGDREAHAASSPEHPEARDESR